MDKIPNQALTALMNTKLSNLALICLSYILRKADGVEPMRIELADMRRDLGYSVNHGTYYQHIRSALAELNGTFIQYREEEAPVAASTATKQGRNIVFSVSINPIFFEFRENEKNKICDFTSLPRLDDLPKLRGKYRMRLIFLALRWQSGQIAPSMSLLDFKRWFCMPLHWKPSEVLGALVCAQRIALSLGLSVSFTLSENKKSLCIAAQKTDKVQISDETATAYRKRIKDENKKTKAQLRSKLYHRDDAELGNFARTVAEKYHGKTFSLGWLNNTIVHIDPDTGLLVTDKGRTLSEANCRRFYLALMAKEGA
jgi:hypothetical protein